MTMDYHSKNVCLIAILHIVSCLIELSMLLYPRNYPRCLRDEARPLAYLVLLIISACLVIGGVKKRRYKLLIPFLVLTSLLLAQVGLPVLTSIAQGYFSVNQSLDRIGFGIVTVYSTYTLCLELYSQEGNKCASVVAINEPEKKIIPI